MAATVRDKEKPQSVLTWPYFILFGIIEPLMAINGTYLTWFKTTQFFRDSVPGALNAQIGGLDGGTKMAVTQLGWSWLAIAWNSHLLLHTIPRVLPYNLAAQERLINIILLSLLGGDIHCFVSALQNIPRPVLLDVNQWTAVVLGNVGIVCITAILRVAFIVGIGRPTSWKWSKKAKAT